MIKFKSVLQQLIDERNKNALFLTRIEKLLSDMDYIAMMCDISLEEDENE